MVAAVDEGAPKVTGIPRLSFQTADPEEARWALDKTFYPNYLDVLDREHRLSAVFHTVQPGPVTVGDLPCGADVRMRFGELGAYHVDIPVTGRLFPAHLGPLPHRDHRTLRRLRLHVAAAEDRKASVAERQQALERLAATALPDPLLNRVATRPDRHD